MSEWRILSEGAAFEAFESIRKRLEQDPSCDIKPDLSSLTKAERAFREMLVRSAAEAIRLYPRQDKSRWYFRSLHIGLDMFQFFESRPEQLLLWDAYDSKMWMQLSLNVVPDIIHDLDDNGPARSEVFYSRPNRMLLRKVWWFIYLSMKTDAKGRMDRAGTLARLEPLRDQDAKDLLDRNAGGYHIEFTRDMMGRYSEYCVKRGVTGQTREEFFQALIREHHLRLQFTLPELEGYERYFAAILKHAEKVIVTRKEKEVARKTAKQIEGNKSDGKESAFGSLPKQQPSSQGETLRHVKLPPRSSNLSFDFRTYLLGQKDRVSSIIAQASAAKAAIQKLDKALAENSKVDQILAAGDLNRVKRGFEALLSNYRYRNPQANAEECWDVFVSMADKKIG